MVCYLKWEASSGPISFEVKRNNSWTDTIQSFEAAILVQQHWELELVNERQLGKAQITASPPDQVGGKQITTT